MIRWQVTTGAADPHDERRDLWRSFLEIIQLARPRAVMMENVPDMALDREMFILRGMTEKLEQIGYSVSARVIDTWRYRVPQMRRRFATGGITRWHCIRGQIRSRQRVTLWNAIGDMPEVEADGVPRAALSDGPLPRASHSISVGSADGLPRQTPTNCSTTSRGPYAKTTGQPSIR